MKSISCAEIGIDDCEFQIFATEGSDLVEDMLQHLRRDHRYDIPDGAIGDGGRHIEAEPERMIVARLRRRVEQV